LYNLDRYDSINDVVSNTLVIMDMEGGVFAQKDLGSAKGDESVAEFIDPSTILVGTEWGAALWHLGNDTMQFLNFMGHHEYEYNPNSKTVFTLGYHFVEINDELYIFDYIREYALNGTLVWEVDVHDFISEEWWCPFAGTVGGQIDISHSNTIFYDVEEDAIYLLARNVNTFYKINHTSGEVIWSLGEYGDFQMYDIHGTPVDHLFFHAHAVEKISETTFILFDNDYHNQTMSGNRISRILELEIDEISMVARETWYYEAPFEYFSVIWGDADRLPNGNRIGCWGYFGYSISQYTAALIEVNPQGEIVWETKFKTHARYHYGVYRLERFRFEPIISSPPDLNKLIGPGTVSWDVWFDYRNKEPLPGNYTLYFDGNVTETGSFYYSKFWNPTSLVMPYGELSPGIHNLTLVISDGHGNIASDSVLLTPQDDSFPLVIAGVGSIFVVIALLFGRRHIRVRSEGLT
jgi:hypothetical protein